MSTPTLTRRRLLAGSAVLAGTVAAPSILRAQSGGTLNLYSSRHYDTDEALYEGFERLAGVRISRVDAGPDELLERLANEGSNTPADVLITVDAGRLERAAQRELLQPVDSAVLNERIPANLRDPDGHWYGVSTRARVIMYAKDRVDPSTISTYEELADSRWEGRVLTRSSSNIYSQSLTGSILAANGPEATLEWCEGLVANFARSPRGGDTDQIKAVAAGEGDLAISNTYYLGRLMRSENEEDREIAAQIGVIFPNQDGRGTHVNISGAGITRHSPNPDLARAFLEYLASDEAQFYFADGNNEYPVVPGVEWPETMQSLGTFEADELNARVFARNNAEALRIMDRAGWT
ncbi:MAG: Fe(3+) ABC transporter substrate-binding protein [Pseudomonadota bacterium]